MDNLNIAEKVVMKMKEYYGEDIDVYSKDDGIFINGDLKFNVMPDTTDAEIEDIAMFLGATFNLHEPKEEHNTDNDDKQKEGLTNVSNVATAMPVTDNETKENLESIADSFQNLTEYPSLLIALESERDAIVTYETLIDIEKKSETRNQEVIDLLEKVLVDEKEHIALLSALQAKNTSEFVADDAKEEFDSYVDAMN